jgi:Phage protein Gp138 N-terminal domain/GpV Apex motif
MDRRERLEDLETALLAAIRGNQASVWTALPGRIHDFNAAKMTVSVEPTIQALLRLSDGQEKWVSIPMLVDCPVIFPSGGGFTLTFPVVSGDECLVIFSSRCIDAWWHQGGIQVQADLRMHDLSDGFAMVGPRSQPRVLSPAASAAGVELRNDARTAFVGIDGSANVRIQTTGNAYVVADGNVQAAAGAHLVATAGSDAQVTASTITLNGNVLINGGLSVSGMLVNNGKDVGAYHRHSGVQTGGGTTGAPV